MADTMPHLAALAAKQKKRPNKAAHDQTGWEMGGMKCRASSPVVK
jgi:hypothetical protein